MNVTTVTTPHVGSNTGGERAGSTRALVLATSAFLVCFTVWGLIPPLAPTFRDKYHLSNVGVGFLVAVPTLLGALARLPLGILAEHAGRVVFTVLLIGLTIPLALAGFTNSFGTVLAVSLLLGVAGASFAVGVPFVSSWFSPAKQGFALGIYGMGNFGTAISNLLAPRLEDHFGLSVVFWCFIPVLLAMAALFTLLARDAPVPPRPRQRFQDQVQLLRTRPLSWMLALFYFVTFGGLVGITVYLPILLVDKYDITRTDAGMRAAGFVAIATIARPLGGLLADRWTGTVVLDVVFLIVAGLAIILAFEPGMVVLTITVLAIAAMLGAGSGAVFKLVATIFPHDTGTVTGLVGAAGGLGGFFPPLVVSAVHSATGSRAIAFMLLSEFALGCLIINRWYASAGSFNWFRGLHDPPPVKETP